MVGGFRADPPRLVDDGFASATQNYRVALPYLDVGLWIGDFTSDAQPFHEMAEVHSADVAFDFLYCAWAVEEVGVGDVGAERDCAVGNDISGGRHEVAGVHLRFKRGRLGLYFLDSAEQQRAEVGDYPCRTDRSENVAYGIAGRYKVEHMAFLLLSDGERFYGVAADTDYCRYGLRTGEYAYGNPFVVAHQLGDADTYSDAYHTFHQGETNLFQTLSPERTEKLRTNAVSDGEKK